MSNHTTRSIHLSLLRCSLGVAALIGPLGCDDAADLGGEQLADAPSAADDREYIADLAWRYLEKEVDDEEARRIGDEIEALSPTQMRLMNKELQLLGDADPRQAEFGDRLTEIAIERGAPMFAVSQDDIGRAIAESSAVAAPRALCDTWAPSSPTQLHGFNSTASGATAQWSDRRSTGWFEFGGCDHRFYFSGKRQLIDGKSTAYDKWIASYPSILGQHTLSGTYAVMGNYRAEANGIYNVSASMVKAYY